MDRGRIPIDDLAGGIDLFTTLESGQSYLWTREDGRMYEGARTTRSGEQPWYATVVDGRVIRVRRVDGAIEWQGSEDVAAEVRSLLRLDDDLPAIRAASPGDDLVREAWAYAPAMRLVRDPPFGSLISFICSAQMRVSRIHGMTQRLARTYGRAVEFDGSVYHEFPDPDSLAAATEAELRELSLGYRAPYVERSAELVASGEYDPEVARELPYLEAREYLTNFVGVGEKVADCVLLFSLDHLEAVPLDTWIRTAIADYFPECDRGNYAETSAAIREAFGGEYAGYVQTYVFHYLRTREE